MVSSTWLIIIAAYLSIEYRCVAFVCSSATRKPITKWNGVGRSTIQRQQIESVPKQKRSHVVLEPILHHYYENPKAVINKALTLLWSEASSNNQEPSSDSNNSKKSIGGKLKDYLAGNKENDGLTFRQRLTKMGLATVLSYGWVSNMSYCVSVSLAWYGFSFKTSKSPLAPGQWKPFLAVYAGFYVFNNIVRPIRFAMSVAVAPVLDKVVKWVQEKLSISKGLAIGLTVFIVNVIGTTSLMCAGIALASALAGVPVFPPKA